MGMSASQARLLSLTARMHDLEFEAQSIQYAKLDLVDSKDDVYDKYLEALDSTKFQMAIATVEGKEFQDITYTNMITANTGGGLHSMYILTKMDTGEVMLPEQIASRLVNKDPEFLSIRIDGLKEDGTPKTKEEKQKEYIISVARNRVFPNGVDSHGNELRTDEDYYNAMKAEGKDTFYGEFPDEERFLMIVAKNYLYSGRIDLTDDSDYIQEMKNDGNYTYWKGVYDQIIGYEDENGVPIAGRGYCGISRENATDRTWLEESLNNAEVQLYKMTKQTSALGSGSRNIFAETTLATDTELREVSNEELIREASVEYEKAIKDIDAKETKLDLQLTRIDQQHNALKTEYDSVKQIVSKNIDRSFKSFNA